MNYVASWRQIPLGKVYVAESFFHNFEDDGTHTAKFKFEPADDKPFLNEFNKLARSEGWDRQEYRDNKSKAIKSEFDLHFLTSLNAFKIEDGGALNGRELNERRLECYRVLCKELHKEEPKSIEHARQILKSRPWVNIIDLLDAKRKGKPFSKHLLSNDFKKFEHYTIEGTKCFNLQAA